MTKKIRVLIVDDSVLIREMIGDALRETPDLEVAGMAGNGLDALARLEDLKPDVVTLDVQMPKMDGLETLREILKRKPVPVIMVSALTRLGADTTLEALDQGALDYIAKPDAAHQAAQVLREDLPRKIRSVAGVDVTRMLRVRKSMAERRKVRAATLASTRTLAPTPFADPNGLTDKCVAIAISTGGPPALTLLFEELTPPMPPIVVVQHMPADFTKPFAWRLNSISRLEIKEAQEGDALLPNHVYIAPGGKHLELRERGGQTKTHIFDGDLVSGHRPSCDVTMKSAAVIYGHRCLGMIMTGMGRDGADGCGEIRRRGGYVLGQDEASSDVYGMNKVAQVEGCVDKQFALEQAATILTQQIKRLWTRTGNELAAAT